jgi:hypothetical protein
MKLELTINLTATNTARAGIEGLCVLGAFTLSADTALYEPFATGEDLTAEKLDANFKAIIDDVDRLNRVHTQFFTSQSSLTSGGIPDRQISFNKVGSEYPIRTRFSAAYPAHPMGHAYGRCA